MSYALTQAIGARLVHDLKKGIISQLNRLEKEPDAENLENHFKHLELLNKYIHLLSSNLKHEREVDWILFTPATYQNYLKLILGAPTPAEMATPSDWPQFFVPEISFYRILKNIFENFNNYGSGTLELDFKEASGRITLKAINDIAEAEGEKQTSTHLGIEIIQQLLADNFGEDCLVKQEKGNEKYCLTLTFPALQEKPT